MIPYHELVDQALEDVTQELISSTARHGLYASAHEGSSVAREEFEELWEHVRANTGYSIEAYHEAKQLASTAVKYMLMVKTQLLGSENIEGAPR